MESFFVPGCGSIIASSPFNYFFEEKRSLQVHRSIPMQASDGLISLAPSESLLAASAEKNTLISLRPSEMQIEGIKQIRECSKHHTPGDAYKGFFPYQIFTLPVSFPFTQ